MSDVITRKMALLRSLQPGWDGSGAKPINETAAAHFEAFVAQLPADRIADAEPAMRDNGSIVIEWKNAGFDCTAEIGADELFLCKLAPDAADDASVELDGYDANRLTSFFLHGHL